ncbi:type 1 glutamine amidotransferase [Salinifilum ghardaiensis]
MGSPRILAVQPGPDNPPEVLGDWLVEAGAVVDTLTCESAPIPAELGDHDALVVLDGPMGSYDDDEHPWLPHVRALLSSAVTQQAPVLALGLGAHLLASVTGGRTRTVPHGPQIGPGLIAKRDSAADDPLFGSVPLTPDVLCFHTEEVATLPPSAVLLASSPGCDHQLFRIGPFAYGLQFHIGTTTDTVLRWLGDSPELAETRGQPLSREVLDRFHEDAAETWRPVAERFAHIASLPPEERSEHRLLPVV